MVSDRPTNKADEPENKNRHGQSTPADNQSLLDFAVHRALDPALKMVTSDAETTKAVEDGARDFLKIVPLFMHGRLAIAGTVATYVSDEIKRSDHGSDAAIDAALGAAKAASLLTTQRWLGTRNTTPSLMGVEMGIVNRATDTGLTRQNYYDSNGKFDLKAGLEKAAKAAASSAPTDLLAFGAADALWGGLDHKFKGLMAFNPIVTSALTASTFNVTTAAGAELTRQLHEGKLDVASITTKSLSAAVVGFTAGGLAGLQRRSVLSTGIVDSPTAIAEARSTPFQKGELVDDKQRALKNGEFLLDKALDTRHNLTFIGKVVNDGSEVPAVFRAPKTEPFEHRQQSEIGAYGLSAMLNLPSETFPATVARSAEINGVKFDGFIQEMKGETLKHHFDDKAASGEMHSGRRGIIKELRENPELVKQLHASWSERLIFGEWDNHAANQMLLKQEKPKDNQTLPNQEKPKAFNIDLGSGFHRASTTLDYTPNPLQRQAYDWTNSYVYKELTRTKFDPDLTAALKQFVASKDTVEGRQEIGQLGFTPQQVDGIIGKAKWLASNERLPKGAQTMTTPILIKPLLRAIRGHLEIRNSLAQQKAATRTDGQLPEAQE
jgi:hypothetical protein